MTVTIGRRASINLQGFMRVAWKGEGVEVSAEALELVARRRSEFGALVAAHQERKLYGVNVQLPSTGSSVCAASSSARARVSRRWPRTRWPSPGCVVPPALEQLQRRVPAAVPVVTERRTLGPELEQLSTVLTSTIPE
jgi:hypothetical protein